MKKPVTCYRCNVAMVPPGSLRDLSCHGPNAADVDFRGILVEVHRCPSCAGVATRPAAINLPDRARLAAAV